MFQRISLLSLRDRMNVLWFLILCLVIALVYLSLIKSGDTLTESLHPQDLSNLGRNYVLRPPPPDGTEYVLENSLEDSAQNIPMISFVQNILRQNGVTKGFFIESGAHDGEYLSNTLFLEKDFGWKGLLVEPDPIAFDKLLKKRRKSWTANVCLSTTNSEMDVTFHVNTKFRVLGRIQNDQAQNKWDPNQTQEFQVKCVPLARLLAKINVTTVDYFSLDIEGNELDVLKTIPFDEILIKVLTIENNLIPGGPKVLNNFMRSQNYVRINPKKYMDLETLKTAGALDSLFVHESLTLNNS